MKAKPKIILYRESLAQSIISDLSTFGFLLLCIWASWGSTGWTFLSASLFIMFFVSKLTLFSDKNIYRFYSLEDMREWLDTQEPA